MSRHHHQLADNLPLLQNLIKRDPASYHSEMIQQYENFQSLMQLFSINPNRPNKTLEELIMFLAQIQKCFPTEMANFPNDLKNLLQSQATVLSNEMRFAVCKALILLRNRGTLDAFGLLTLFFELLGCNDKPLRKFLQTHIIQDVKKMNLKHRNEKINRDLQNFMFSMLNEKNEKAAKMSLNIMTALYKKNIWHDSKTVNIIANGGCFSKFPKVMVCALKFFATADREKGGEGDSENDSGSESDGVSAVDARQVALANKFNKKTKKREKLLKKTKKLVAKNKRKQTNEYGMFSAIHLVYDAQELADKLFQQLQSTNKRFEVKLLHLNVIAKLIGVHGLVVLNYYAYIQRYLQPKQREVTSLLLFAAQSSHALVPPELIEPLVEAIVNNFVSERNSTDARAIGLNAIREICSRCPLAISKNTLQELVEHKNSAEKSIMMAARSILQLYRQVRPDLLDRKQLGKPTQAQVEYKSRQYAEQVVHETIPGIESIASARKSADVSHTDLASDTILDDEDFRKIEIFNLRKQLCMTGAKKKLNEKNNSRSVEEPNSDHRGHNECSEGTKHDDNDDHDHDDDHEDYDFDESLTNQLNQNTEIVHLGQIENIYKKRKHDKESRLETVEEGRESRDKYGYKDNRKNIHCSKTQKEKKKNKHFQMLKPKLKSKSLKSFREKQQRLRAHLIKTQKSR